LKEGAVEHGIPSSSLKRYLVRLLEMQIIEKEDGIFKNIKVFFPNIIVFS